MSIAAKGSGTVKLSVSDSEQLPALVGLAQGRVQLATCPGDIYILRLSCAYRGHSNFFVYGTGFSLAQSSCLV